MGRWIRSEAEETEGFFTPTDVARFKNPSVTALKKRRATSPFARRRTGRRQRKRPAIADRAFRSSAV